MVSIEIDDLNHLKPKLKNEQKIWNVLQNSGLIWKSECGSLQTELHNALVNVNLSCKYCFPEETLLTYTNSYAMQA